MIWKETFFNDIIKFKKSDLLILIEDLSLRLSTILDKNYSEYDFKDCLFDQKCNLIETLDPDFFHKKD